MNRFPDHARVLFIGDSITCCGLWIGHIYDHYLRHFPGSDIRMYNAGISGGSITSAESYFDQGNGANYAPTHAVIMLGMNDIGRGSYAIDPAEDDIAEKKLDERMRHIATYEVGLRRLAGMLLARGIKLTFVAPTGYDESQLPRALDKIGCDAGLEYLGELNRRLAEETGSDFVNFHAPMRYLNTALTMTRPDRVHPDDMGHVCMAHIFLAAQGLVPEPTVLTLDALPDPGALLDCSKARLDAEKDVRTLWNCEWLILRGHNLPTFAQRADYMREFRKNAPTSYFESLVDRFLELGDSMPALMQREIDCVEACARNA